jgi:formylglycine-generating enzyme required for sulfatase activity
MVLLVVCVVVIATAGSVWAQARPTERVSPAPQVNSNAVVWRTPAPPNSPQAGDVWVNPRDEMELVYVAPGEFTFGSTDEAIDDWLRAHPDHERYWIEDERPQSRISLPGYWMGRTEVTNGQYLRFVQATGRSAPRQWVNGRPAAGTDRLPVVYVSWHDANAYAGWAGGRLPSELEWEKAARGTDGRLFPWGNNWDRSRCRSSVTSVSGPSAVGSYPTGASPYGCMDMSGNTDEWCADWYDAIVYRQYARGDTSAPRSGDSRVLRGGCWTDELPSCVRCTFRNGSPPDGSYEDTGFRCARNAAR